MKNVIENNKLIAKFMGDYFDTGLEPAYFIHNNKEYEIKDCLYHCNWDWLMPVLEKILNDNKSCANMGAKGYLSFVPEKYIFSMLDDQINGVATDSEISLIEAVYKAVVEFIKKQNEKML